MRYIHRLNKEVNKGNEIYTQAKQRSKQKSRRYIQRLNKEVNKGDEIYTTVNQRSKQRQ